jgi:NADH-quinone oxidoreductase subunit E
MRHVAEAIRCTPADVEDIVSFYTMFYTRPVGRHVIQVCRTLSCALMGAERVTDELAHTLGIAPGETDKAGEFTLLEVECLGACDRAPVVGVNDHWQECQRPEDVRQLVDGLRNRGPAALTGCHLKVEK